MPLGLILVTGAGGNVGSSALAALRAAGRPVRAAFHRAEAAAIDRDGGGDAVALDFNQSATLAPALHAVTDLLLIGAMGPAQTEQELALVAAAASAGVRRVVKLSVWRADEELTPVARLHRPVEQAIVASGLAWSFLRPNFYMQNFGRAGAAIAAGTLAQPASGAPISFIDARDVAAVAVTVLSSGDRADPGKRAHDSAIYDLTGPEALTYDEAAAVFATVLRTPVRHVSLTSEVARAAMLARGLPSFHVEALLQVAAAYRDGGADTVTSTVADLTGRPPRSLADYARDHRAAFA